MNAFLLALSMPYGLCGAALIGLGLYGFVTRRNLLRRILCFNLIGSGIFLMFGAAGAGGSEPGADPVPQALIITGIVVAFSATALAVALLRRHAALSGMAELPDVAKGEGAPLPAPDDREATDDRRDRR